MKHFYLLFFSFLYLTSCNTKAQEENTNASIFGGISLFKNAEIAIDTNKINSFKDSDLKSLYKNRNFKTIWNEEILRNQALTILNNTNQDGLLSTNYSASLLKKLNESYTTLPDSSKVSFDLLLSLNLKTFLQHLHSGRFKPKDVYPDWDLNQNQIDIVGVLTSAIDKIDLQLAYYSCEPKHETYKQLKLALQLLEKMPKDSTKIIELSEKLIPFKNNKAVINIKKKLQYWKDVSLDTFTSNFDKKTILGIKKFQKRHGLIADGIVGKSTIEALNCNKQQREEQIVANLERWRWFASDFGENYLLLNIPDYALFAMKKQDTMQIQRIVVGKESRRTPVLESQISNIVLNPNWTVPPTILKEDVFPLAMKDKSTFAKKGLNIINKKGETVNPYSWQIADAWKYKYVQNPSRNNSLGLMKINFPNNHSVYLHDTNHRDYFDIHKRSLSSGCVRLEKPLIMAAYLLNDSLKWNIQKVRDTTDIKHYIKLQNEKQNKIAAKNKKLLAKNPDLILEIKEFPKPKLKTISIPIKEKIKIYQLYWTAWIQNNQLQFREDIYCLDHLLYQKLRN